MCLGFKQVEGEKKWIKCGEKIIVKTPLIIIIIIIVNERVVVVVVRKQKEASPLPLPKRAREKW
jgi:hypothetical protein